ncbi:SAM-dependent methyltransferase [Telmatospirillum siberiense]|uniref:site-specific DNA-methyltransferase (adenine-specific) n=2 Tax=Telmatospirillum siberiense TaxID=382514 RepID=A0A2N3PSW5_9PROT|nr:SAM-dependent methyltransferase [Telmatospirillum siberiense]
MSRALSVSSPEADRLALARAFGVRLITAWWRALTAEDDAPPPLRAPLQAYDQIELPDSAVALADSLGESAADLDAEQAAYQIGLIYTGMLPSEHRGEFGIYYTPPSLTARLIHQATVAGVDWTRARVLDPACGGGAFLTPVAQRIIDSLPNCSPAILIENIATRLRGYEIDPFGAWLSQVSLDAVVLPVSRAAGRRLPLVVTVCNSLHRSPPRERFDLVIGNPPYGRVRLDEADRARFKRGLYGHANLYGLFTDMAIRHARPDGVIAYVTPTSFLAGHYFKNLRALLARNAPPVTFDFVAVRKGVFDDVLQETLLATYRRGAKSAGAAVHEITPTDEMTLSVEDAGTIPLPVDPSQPWLLPRTARQAPLVAQLARMTHRLADWGYGVSTGPLVWNRFKDQLADQPGRGRQPLIWAEAVTSEGTFLFRAEKKNHAPYFELRRGDDWLKVDAPCVLLQRTTAKEQARRLIAACLPTSFLKAHGGSVVVENHLNMVKPIIREPTISPDLVAAFLNSAAADRVFRCVSGSVAVSAYELEALPLPAPEDLDELKRLVESGAKRERIEAECTRLYAGVAE